MEEYHDPRSEKAFDDVFEFSKTVKAMTKTQMHTAFGWMTPSNPTGNESMSFIIDHMHFPGWYKTWRGKPAVMKLWDRVFNELDEHTKDNLKRTLDKRSRLHEERLD